MSFLTRFGKHRSWLVGLALLAAALVAGLVFRHALVAWFTGGRVGGAEGKAVVVKAGGLGLSAALDPDPPRAQGQTLLVTVSDAEGKPVDDAKVDVLYDMPAMGAMAEMKGPATVSHEGAGRYRATFDLPMGGTWTLKTTVDSKAGSSSQDFSMTVGSSGLTATTGGAMAMTMPMDAGAPQTLALPPAGVDSLRGGMDAYARIRETLASDRTDGVVADARTLSEALRAALETLPKGPSEAREMIARAVTSSDALARTSSLEDARTAFGAASRDLLAVIARAPGLQAGWRVFQCPMADGHPRWMQRKETADNPYMGTKMLTCGDENAWSEVAQATSQMAPSDYDVTVDQTRRQLIGVRTGRAEVAPMTDSIRAVGKLGYDESGLTDVNLKVRGWIDHLYVTETGQRVRRGQPLFSLYSPELYAAEQDYLLSLHGQSGPVDGGAARVPYLAGAARERLRLLGMSDGQLAALAGKTEPQEHVTFYAPASGYVIEKNVVEGASVTPGQRLYRIASLDKVWVEAEVYEQDLPHVTVGEKATVTLDYVPGRTWDARVAYVYPYLDTTTRTGRVRVVLKNADMDLRPGMYATVMLQTDLGPRLQVPVSAVVYTGPRRLVFLDLGDGRFRPTEVTVGARAGGRYEVLDGLRPGAAIAVSGVFLIAADARINTSAPFWESGTERDR